MNNEHNPDSAILSDDCGRIHWRKEAGAKMTFTTQPALPGIPLPGDMPDGWIQSTEPCLDHKRRTGHELSVCEDDAGVGWVLCETCECFWYAGTPHWVSRYMIAAADRMCRGRKADVR